MDPVIAAALAGLPPKAKQVYDAFVAHGEPMTDDELAEVSGIGKGTASPRRADLARAGLLEVAGHAKTKTGSTAKTWRLVPADRVAAVAEAAADKGERVKDPTKRKLEERVEIVRRLLEMDDVNAAIQNRKGKAWSRVRGRGQDEKSARERARRENAAKLREAERRGSPQAEYYKLRRALLESGDKVRAVRQLVDEELDRRFEPGGQVIPVQAWPDVVDLLDDLERDARECAERVREVMGAMDGDVIEGEAVEVDDFMKLLEGDDAADAA